MKLNSLRFRSIASYSLSAVLLLAFYGWALYGTVRITEDEVINRILALEADSYFEKYTQDKNTQLPSLRNLQSFTSDENLPGEFYDLLKSRKDGIYETSGPSGISGPSSHNILIRSLPDGPKRLFLIYDSSAAISQTDCVLSSIVIFFIVFIVTAIFGIILSYIIGTIIFRPLNSLTERLEHYGPESIEQDLPEAKRGDEIGILASNIQSSFNRVQEFIKREQEFTRDASHELRTPLSVIKGAAELLQLSPHASDKAIKKPLSRIERSVNNMENTISTLLWLAREQDLTKEFEPFNLSQAINKTVQNLNPLIEHKKIMLQMELDTETNIVAPEQAFHIVFSNILNNAINFSGGGTIGIKTNKSHLTVWDTGTGISKELLNEAAQPFVKSADSSGFGLGLSIVQRLCTRFDWGFSIRRRNEDGTIVSIEFKTTPHPSA